MYIREVTSKRKRGPDVTYVVLSLRGRYGKVTETLGVKETRITDGGRPERPERVVVRQGW